VRAGSTDSFRLEFTSSTCPRPVTYNLLPHNSITCWFSGGGLLTESHKAPFP
jgi:hypothetical protein